MQIYELVSYLVFAAFTNDLGYTLAQFGLTGDLVLCTGAIWNNMLSCLCGWRNGLTCYLVYAVGTIWINMLSCLCRKCQCIKQVILLMQNSMQNFIEKLFFFILDCDCAESLILQLLLRT